MSRSGMQKRRYDYEQKVARRVNEIRTHWYADAETITDLAAFETMDHISPAEAGRGRFRKVKVGWKWGRLWGTAWFRLRFRIPAAFKGETVVLLFDCGGEAVAFINGAPVQGLDRNRNDIILLPRAKGGERFEILVEAGANGAFGKYAGKVELTRAAIAVLNREVRDYYYDIQSCSQYIDAAPKDDTRSSRLLFAASRSVDAFDYIHTDKASVRASARRAQRELRGVLAAHADDSAQVFACAGHAHIDVAWLWPLSETVRKCARTFSTAVKYMDEYPEYVFAQSQPQLYEYTRERYPALYKRIKEKVKKGQWEPVGCMWVEADCNLCSGESLVRQILFGTRFFKQEFNYDVDSLWLPDVFGYAASLPQILIKSGMRYFTTQKISWSQYTVFPYHTFRWQGIDGTKILSHFPPADTYNCMIKADHLLQSEKRYNEQDRSGYQLHQYGFGDGGGGPTRDHIERIRRFRDFEGMPRTVQMTSAAFFRKLEQEAQELPEWAGELYLELHRGTLTTQAHNKWYNRKSELLYRDTEMLCAWDLVNGGSYPQKALNDGWKKILLNQFHDVIPGSSIALVYEDSTRDYAWVLGNGMKARDKAAARLAAGASTAGCRKPAVIFNTLSWDRADVTAVDGVKKDCIAVGPDGTAVPVQSVDGKGYFHARVPAAGFAVYDLAGRTEKTVNPISVTRDTIENRFYRIRFDANGDISSLYDKLAGREVIAAGCRGNIFKLFEDKPNNWDAWDMFIFYNDKMLETAQLVKTSVQAAGPVVGILRQERTISQSRIVQDVIVYADVPRIDFRTEVYWGDEKEVMLKVAFPVDVVADKATYEIQYGNVERPTHWNRPADFAMFEVCGHKWADLSEGGYGVSLLNDSKYGHDIKGGEMRLTLLRAPKSPDPTADINKNHTFTYALYPHTGDFRNGTVRAGYELNVPLQAVKAAAGRRAGTREASLVRITGDDLVVEVVKKAEDSRSLIVRLYEAHKRRGRATLELGFTPKAAFATDLMERDIRKVACRGGKVSFAYKPFEIITFRLEL